MKKKKKRKVKKRIVRERKEGKEEKIITMKKSRWSWSKDKGTRTETSERKNVREISRKTRLEDKKKKSFCKNEVIKKVK